MIEILNGSALYRARRIVLGSGMTLTETSDGLPTLVASVTGTIALNDLTDVTITTVAANQTLRYDSGTSQWINNSFLSNTGSAIIVGTDPGNGPVAPIVRIGGGLITKARSAMLTDGTASAGFWLGVDASAQVFVGQNGLTNASPFGVWHGGAWRLQVLSTGEVDVNAGPLIIGTSPGGSQLVRIGGGIRVQGAPSPVSEFRTTSVGDVMWFGSNTAPAASDPVLDIRQVTSRTRFEILTYDGSVVDIFMRLDHANPASGGIISLVPSAGSVVIGTDPGGTALLRVGGRIATTHTFTNGDRVSNDLGHGDAGFGFTVAGYQDNNGAASLWHNAYVLYNTAGSATVKWGATHATFGSRGIWMDFTTGPGMGASGIGFYADNAAATIDTAFTPSLRMLIRNDGGVEFVTAGTVVESNDSSKVRIWGSSNARIQIFPGSSGAPWQIDNNSGTLRFFLPGAVKVSVDSSGNTTIVTGGASNTGKLTANRMIAPVGTSLWAT